MEILRRSLGRRSLTAALVVFSTAGILTSRGSAAVTAPSSIAAGNGDSRLSTKARVRHVYVLDESPSILYRYPIVGGVVSTVPDSTLDVVGGTSNSSGIAVAHDGTLYVAQVPGDIAVYAPGAHGQQPPQRYIRDAHYGCLMWDIALSLDERYFYVGQVCGGGADLIDALDFQGRVTARIRRPQGIGGLAVDIAGSLYITGGYHSGGREAISVYATPGSRPTLIRVSCTGKVYPGDAIAVGPEGHLFEGGNRYINVLRDTVDSCPLPPHRLLTTVPPFSPINDMVVFGHDLLVTEGARVQELDARYDRQPPIATITGFANADAIAVGP